MLIWLLFGGCFLITLVHIRLPFGVSMLGKPVAQVSLTFRERLLMHRTNIYALGVLLLLGAIGGWIALPLELVLIALALALISIPVRYSFTTEGFTYSNVLFRRWQDFAYVRVHGARVTLVPRHGSASVGLVVQPARRQEVLAHFQRFLPVRRESPPSWREHWMFLWLRRRLPALILSSLLVFTLAVVLSSCGEGPDPSGLNTANQTNLTSVSPNGTPLTQQQLTTARSKEPFAYNLALYVDENRLGINFVWTLITGYLVMFMQLGFALLETGLCRAKNAGHTMGMNIMIYAIGMAGYFAVGFAFQEGGIAVAGGVPNLGGLAALSQELSVSIGGHTWGLLGFRGFFLSGTYDVGVAVMFLFQMVFMDTAATIPTGAMAERWKWSAFCVYGLFISTLVYPVYANWAWGGGWLSQLGNIGLGKGYIDFAGSGVVHAVGGWCALAGAMVLGPRLGKYNRDGSANAIPGHNIVFAIVGCLILAFGWFGFNPGSTLGAATNGNLRIGIVALDTMLSSAFGAITAMGYTWLTGAKKPDLAMMGNGFLAGLVAITAPSGYVSPTSAGIIGAVAGVLVVFFAGVIDRVLKVDDPVGAIAVHGVNGLWGQLSVGLFADGLANYGGLQVTGLFYGGGVSQLGAQIIGAVVCFVYVFGISWIFFMLYKRFFGLRVSAETELAGLDVPELGGLAYNPDAEFYPEPERVAGLTLSGTGETSSIRGGGGE